MPVSKTGPSRAETVSFVANLLAKNAGMKALDVKKAAKAKGFHVYPLIFGLARKELGIAPKAPSGRGPGRPRKDAQPVAAPKAVVKAAVKAAPKAAVKPARAGTSADFAISGVIDHMRSLDAEVARLREVLSQIAGLAGN